MTDPRERSDLAARNKQSWDRLYGSTGQPVWGREPAGFLGESLHRVAPLLGPAAHVLDAGTGEGRNLDTLLGLGLDVHGVDSSFSAIRKIPAQIRSRAALQVCDLDLLPYRNGTFDLAVSIDVIETLPTPDTALTELCRVLRPGGLLLCNIPGEEDPIAGVEMAPLGGDAYLYRDAFFYRFFTEADAAALLERAGFNVLDTWLHSWQEPAHPNFRATEHTHTSRVFVAERTA